MTTSEISLLMTKTEMVSETFVYSPFSHMMSSIAGEDFIEFSRPEYLIFYVNKIELMNE